MISVHQLSKCFGQAADRVLAVDGISFQVVPGEVYGLLGPNGAGKTTTLRMILGLLNPTSGYADVEGVRTSEAPLEVKSRIGLVSAESGLYPWLSPREVVLYFADLYGVPPSEAVRRLAWLAERLGIRDYLDRRCAVLSTGQKQRVILARALIHDPPVMLLDEPTRGLDVVGSQVIFNYIRTLRQQGKAVILSTHRLDEAQRFCDRFGLLSHGRLVREGTLDELQQATGKATLVEMFLELTGDTLLPEPAE